MKILLVEDDESMCKFVASSLEQEGHSVDRLGNGRDALAAVMDPIYDVLIVDRMLPGLDGLALVRAMRAAATSTPVIFLTALGGLNDRVEGLKAGADDYLVKPFAFSELSARVGALGRRAPLRDGSASVLRVADVEIDLISRSVKRNGITVGLLRREFQVLELLMRNAGRVVTRTMLLEKVWDFHHDPETSVVETHVSRLRAKIDKPFATQLIQTVRGLGYSLDAPG